jgi:hypothetical protein
MISEDMPHEGGTYPYPLLTGLDTSDPGVVSALVMALHEHYDDYKDADPGAIGWALDRQKFRWVVPYHEGAVQAYRELGVWADADQAHNERLLARQALLARAWLEMEDSSLEGDDFREDWMQRRKAALEAEGFDPIWH